MCDTEATEGMEPCLVDAYCFQNRIKQTVSQVRVAERLACRRCKYQARSAVTDEGYQFGSHIGMHIHDSVRIVSLETIRDSATGSLLRYRDRCSIVRNVLDGQPQQLTETKASRCYQEKQHALLSFSLSDNVGNLLSSERRLVLVLYLRQIDELMVPLSWVDFFAILIDCRSNDQLYQTDVVVDTLRRQLCLHHLLYEFLDGSVVHILKQHLAKVRKKPLVQSGAPCVIGIG